jgi:HEAT repeat protein
MDLAPRAGARPEEPTMNRLSRFCPSLPGPVLGVVSMLILLACSACAPPAARQARALMAQGDPAGAEAAADQGLAGDPGHDELWRLKIEAALAGGDAGRAIELYQTWQQRRGEHDRELLGRLARLTLAQGLRVPSGQVRAAAVQAIERQEIVSLAPHVAARIEDDEDLVAAAAAVALLRSEPGAARVAAQLLRSDDPAARALVITGIARKLGAATRDSVRAALGDRDAGVRRAAVRALPRMAEPADWQRLAGMAGTDPDARVRIAALQVLSRLPGRAAVPEAAVAAAKQALASTDQGTNSGSRLGSQLAAIALLARHGDTATLQGLAATAEPVLAVAAAEALAGRTPTLLAEAIQRGLADPAPDVRQAVLEAARKLPDAEAARLAHAHVQDQSWDVRLVAARVLLYLGETGDAALRQQAAPIFAAALAGAEVPERLRVQAAIDLARMGDARGSAALSELGASADPNVRQSVVGAYPLVHARQPELAQALLRVLARALADESPLVRILAAETLVDNLDSL